MFLNNIHSIIKMSARLDMICECEQPYNNDVRYGMSIRFSLNTRLCLLKNFVFSLRGYHRYFKSNCFFQ